MNITWQKIALALYAVHEERTSNTYILNRTLHLDSMISCLSFQCSFMSIPTYFSDSHESANEKSVFFGLTNERAGETQVRRL